MSEQIQAQTRKDIEARIIAKAWKDDAYKQELFSNSKAIFEQEFGLQFSENVSVHILEENPTSLYLALPMSPLDMAKELSPEELEAIAGGASGPIARAIMAGTTLVVTASSYFAGRQVGRS